MTEKELVERISLARSMAKMSARELSLKADLNEAYISRLETANNSKNHLTLQGYFFSMLIFAVLHRNEK